MIEDCLFALHSLRDVLGEQRRLTETALRGRALARHKLSYVITILKELQTYALPLENQKETYLELNANLYRWVEQMSMCSMEGEANAQSQYALECARLCHTKAQLIENGGMLRTALVDVGAVLVRLAEWLVMYPPRECTDGKETI